MDQSVLLIIGLIFATVATIGLVLALYGFGQSLKDTNRKRRSTSVEEHRSINLPKITEKQKNSSKIEFGEVTENEPYYPEGTFVTIKNMGLDSENCPFCRKPIPSSECFTCKNCGTQYHNRCFTELGNLCATCKRSQ